MGLAISFSGLVFRAGEEASAEVAALVPADRLLVETDSPFLTPPGAPRRATSPRFVELTARWVAERRGVGEELELRRRPRSRLRCHVPAGAPARPAGTVNDLFFG